MSKTVRILSIDGGGIRGVIPASLLCEIERRLNNLGCYKPFHKIFDLMAGTSTGGLISISLSVPKYGDTDDDIYSIHGGIKPTAILKLYEQLGEKVFKDYKRKIIKTVRQFFNNKYSPQALNDILSDLFEDYTMHSALTNLLITAFDMIRMQPVFFKNRPKNFFINDEDFYMLDAALSTSSVPTYFPSALVKSVTRPHNTYCLTDGGVFCINPALSAFIEGKKIYPDATKYIILSLGTGIMPLGYTNIKKLQNWGFFEWIAPWNNLPLLGASGEGQKISCNHMLDKLPTVELHRFDVPLELGKADMDNGSKENIAYLKRKASEIIVRNDGHINDLCNRLIQPTNIKSQYTN